MLMRHLALILLFVFSIQSFAQVPTGVINKAMEQSRAKVVVETPTAETSYIRYEELEKLKSPRETMRTFVESMEEVKKGSGSSRAYFDQATRTFNLSRIDENLREVTGRQVAERLINTLDRITKIDFNHIPDDTNGTKWYFRKQTINEGDDAVEAEIAIEKNADGAWRFSPETVKTIGDLYSSVSHLSVVEGVVEYKNWRTRLKSHLPAWASEEFLMFTKGQWLGFIFIFSVGILALSLVRYLTTLYIRALVKKESLNFKEKDHYKATLPFGLLTFSLVGMGGIKLLELDLDSYAVLIRAFYILIALTSVWSAVKIVDLITLHFAKIAKDTHNKFDDVLVPMLSKTSKVLVISFGTILVAHSLTFDIGSILAGLGIGGVAVALAAKDTISNLFGSVTVIMDRPFLIGDYVSLDKGLEGTVEEVGFRSTRIRTPHQSLVSIPNNVLANMAIDNFGMRGSRRFKTFLQMEYSTPVDKLEEFCDRLRYLCKIHPIINPDTAQVYVNDMTDKSINILLTVFFNTTEGNIELDERHKLILEILKLAKEIDIQFAFPTNTMLIAPSDELQNFKEARAESTSL
jgi:MscS family membrane protein